MMIHTYTTSQKFATIRMLVFRVQQKFEAKKSITLTMLKIFTFF